MHCDTGSGKFMAASLDFCRSVVDIMNSDEFILEVPAELRMRRSRRRKDDIMEIDAVAEG